MSLRLRVVSTNPSLAILLSRNGYQVDDVRPDGAGTWAGNVESADGLVLDLGSAAGATAVLLRLGGTATPVLVVGRSEPEWDALGERFQVAQITLPARPEQITLATADMLHTSRALAGRQEADHAAYAGRLPVAPQPSEPDPTDVLALSTPSSDSPDHVLQAVTAVTAVTAVVAGPAAVDRAVGPETDARPDVLVRPAVARGIARTAPSPDPLLKDPVLQVATTDAQPTAEALAAYEPRPRGRHLRPEKRQARSQPAPRPQPQPDAAASASPSALVRALEACADELDGLAEVAAVVLEELVAVTLAEAGALLVRDGDAWRVEAGINLRPLEHRLTLSVDDWIVKEVVDARQVLLIAGSDIARQRLAGVPLASWEYLLAVPVGQGPGLVVLARTTRAFEEQLLETLRPLDEEAAELFAAALSLRRLARALNRHVDPLPT